MCTFPVRIRWSSFTTFHTITAHTFSCLNRSYQTRLEVNSAVSSGNCRVVLFRRSFLTECAPFRWLYTSRCSRHLTACVMRQLAGPLFLYLLPTCRPETWQSTGLCMQTYDAARTYMISPFVWHLPRSLVTPIVLSLVGLRHASAETYRRRRSTRLPPDGTAFDLRWRQWQKTISTWPSSITGGDIGSTSVRRLFAFFDRFSPSSRASWPRLVELRRRRWTKGQPSRPCSRSIIIPVDLTPYLLRGEKVGNRRRQSTTAQRAVSTLMSYEWSQRTNMPTCQRMSGATCATPGLNPRPPSSRGQSGVARSECRRMVSDFVRTICDRWIFESAAWRQLDELLLKMRRCHDWVSSIACTHSGRRLLLLIVTVDKTHLYRANQMPTTIIRWPLKPLLICACNQLRNSRT